MKRILTLGIFSALLIVLVTAPPLPAQVAVETPDTSADVPALAEFHTVIYKVWHDAWPNGDVHLLAQLQPRVEELGNAVAASSLPGILREKKDAWEEAVAELRTIMAEYAAAAEPIDSIKLLAAAERLHAQYEQLVRIIRPAMKEMDDFHRTLYVLYHYQMPKNDMEGIAASVAVLKEKMGLLDKAALPDRLKGKEETFNTARARLSRSVESLDDAVAKGNATTIKSRIRRMHSNYQLLEKVFD